MKVDVTTALGAVTREVKNIEKHGKPAKVIVATRVFDTDPADAWDALTSPQRIPRWFLPIEGELKLGGRYQLIGNAGGVIERCDAPRHLAVTWEMRGDVSWVDVRLEPVAGKTRLTLEHTAHVPEEFWGQFGPGAVGVGWDLSLLGLALHLETGASVAPEASKEWTASDNYKEFAEASSRAWRDASIAFGTDPGAAGEAADRTTAFYTGSGGGDAGG